MSDAKTRILFVCLGNICRSPMAQGVFEHAVEQANLADAFDVDSAGTGAWHIGNPPDARATATAARRGIDLKNQRARQISPADFTDFDHILAMDQSNLDNLKRSAGPDLEHKVELFLENGAEVPDPYYGGGEGFDHALDLIEEGAKALLARLGKGLD